MDLTMKSNYTLHNGIEIPILGFGTINTTKDNVKNAIKVGYRNIDTAEIYGNEELVSQGIREAMQEYNIAREEIFISTKVWHTNRGYDKTMKAFEGSMERLNLDYLDLYLIHWPANAKWHDDWREINSDTWRALEELYKSGRVKSIGVSNYLAHHMEALIEDTEIKPMVNQIEYHPGFAQVESAKYCQKNGIMVEAWSPFGGAGADVLKNEDLNQIASKYKKTPAQVTLRWLVQKGIVPVAKSGHEDRMVTNMQFFDFSLSNEDMTLIDNLPFCGGFMFDPDTAES